MDFLILRKNFYLILKTTKSMKLIAKSLLFAGLLFLGLNVSAQSVQDAGKVYNQANQQFKSRAYGQAVKLYEEALKTCKAAGPDAMQLQSQVQSQLAQAYFWNGISLYQKRQFDNAIAQFKKGANMSALIGNAKYKKLSSDYEARVYASKGNSLLQQKKYSQAAAMYDAGIKAYPNSINAYFGKCLLANDQKNYTELKAMVAKVKSLIPTNPKGGQYYGKARQVAFGAFLNAGASDLQKENYKDALANFDQAKSYYDASGILHYYMAVANLKLKKWDSAIANARKALTLQVNSKSDVYFTLGQAYQGKGMKTQACSSFKKVVKGPNVKSAKYQIKTVLKCK
jgi:tetratricopeptide (TPR) repeat protein